MLVRMRHKATETTASAIISSRIFEIALSSLHMYLITRDWVNFFPRRFLNLSDVAYLMWRDGHLGFCSSKYVKDRNLLEIDCTGCDSQPDLRRQRCLAGTLISLNSDLTVERIALAGTIVKRYSEGSVGVLIKMREVLDTISTLDRELNQRFQIEKTRKELKLCSVCRTDPRKLFFDLKVAFLSDLHSFFHSLRSALEVSNGGTSPRCEICSLQMKRDALIVLREALSLQKHTLKGMGVGEG